jgi:hypothetical protein
MCFRFFFCQSAAQIAYLNHYLRPTQFPLAETLFKRFLKTSPCVDLWKFYLTYVRSSIAFCFPFKVGACPHLAVHRRVNTGPDTRDNIRMAYEFALRHVGHDKDSGELWSDYIQFLKSGEVRHRRNRLFSGLLMSDRPRPHGKNSKRWTLSGKRINALCKSHSITLRSCGKKWKHLRRI